MYVICGPIFGEDPEITERGPEREVQIPDAFYMILVDTDREWQERPTVRLLVHRFGQEVPRDADFTDRNLFGASVYQIEAETQLDFFPLFGELFTNREQREDENPDTRWAAD